MGKYIGQREICKRLKTENHQLPKLNDMIYTKYEGTEWLDDRYIHIVNCNLRFHTHISD